MTNEQVRIKNYDRSIKSAMKFIEKYGVANTTLEMVSKDTGLCRMSVLRYFGDRDGMIVAVIDRMAQNVKKHRGADGIAPEGNTAFEKFSDLLDIIEKEYERNVCSYKFRQDFISFAYHLKGERFDGLLDKVFDLMGYRAALGKVFDEAAKDGSIKLEGDSKTNAAYVADLVCGYLSSICYKYDLSVPEDKKVVLGTFSKIKDNLKNQYKA